MDITGFMTMVSVMVSGANKRAQQYTLNMVGGANKRAQQYTLNMVGGANNRA